MPVVDLGQFDHLWLNDMNLPNPPLNDMSLPNRLLTYLRDSLILPREPGTPYPSSGQPLRIPAAPLLHPSAPPGAPVPYGSHAIPAQTKPNRSQTLVPRSRSFFGPGLASWIGAP
jgi:hypothetical protein